MSIRSHAAALAALLAALVGAPLALAAGSGGGASMPSTPAPREDPQAAYQAGVAALNAQNYREAIRQFRIARRALPNSGTLNYALGLAYNGAGETDDARQSFERAAQADDAPVATRLQLGLAYLQLDRREDAVAQRDALAQMIAACDGACGDARRAQLEAARQQLDQALAPAQPAAGEPETPPPETTGWVLPDASQGRSAYAEAVGLINQERYAAALDALSRADAALGPHPDVLNYMGFASRKLGRFEAAFAYYDQALRLDPNHLGATEYLGELYLQLGDVERARVQLARLDYLCAYGCREREELARWIALAD